MAKAKTSPFWLTASVDLSAAATYTQATIPLSSYIDVADKQAVAILEVDYISQHITTFTRDLGQECMVDYQLTDINRGALVAANDTALISSGALAFDRTDPKVMTNAGDFFPDSFGSIDEARMVVNDDIFFGAQVSSVSAAGTKATIRIKAQVVSLSAKDFMALALTSVASA